MFLNKKSAVGRHGKNQRYSEYRDLTGIYIGFLQDISKFPKVANLYHLLYSKPCQIARTWFLGNIFSVN